MIEFSTGEKIKFLDEVGTGIIKAKLTNGSYLVELEDGFEIPYPAKKLVPVEIAKISIEEKPIQNYTEKNVSLNSENSKELAKNIYLIFEPLDAFSIFESAIKIQLFNNKNDDCYFVVHKQGKQLYEIIAQGLLNASSIQELEILKRSEIDSTYQISLQFIFASKSASQLIAPISKEIKLKPIKFYKLGNFVTLTHFKSQVIAIEIIETKVTLEQTKPNNNFNQYISTKKQITNQLLEVDLHIEELSENHQSISPSEMMALQLSTLRSKLEFAISNNYKKVVFIHGVGSGILKAEIRKVLALYDCIKFNDASFLTYGNGATEVTIET